MQRIFLFCVIFILLLLTIFSGVMVIWQKRNEFVPPSVLSAIFMILIVSYINAKKEQIK